MADIINFPAKTPGKNAPQNEGGVPEPVKSFILGPVGAVGQIKHYSALHPNGYQVSVWSVERPEQGWKAVLRYGTGL